MISVIIPAYNASKTIWATINSVLDQEIDNIEIIVVNDGSTDNTLELLQNFGTKIQVFSQPNQGVSAARNLGFSKSSGDYIQYLDSDDLLATNKLNLQYQALLNSNGDIAYGNYQKFTVNNNSFVVTENVLCQTESPNDIAAFTNFWCPPAVLLYKREICEKLSWKKDLPVIQDARYLFDATRLNAKFVYVDSNMALYRIGQEQSLSQINKLNFVKDCYINALQVHEIWKYDDNYNSQKKTIIINTLHHLINSLSTLNKDLSKQAIDELLKIEPNFIPSEKGLLRTISKIFGYKNAEFIARLKRNFAQ